MLRIYTIGIFILIIAIVTNAIALKLNITTWYDFINGITKNGNDVFDTISIIDYLWLFIGYPLVLGCAYWLGDKCYTILF
jgi:hypothetical protein